MMNETMSSGSNNLEKAVYASEKLRASDWEATEQRAKERLIDKMEAFTRIRDRADLRIIKLHLDTFAVPFPSFDEWTGEGMSDYEAEQNLSNSSLVALTNTFLRYRWVRLLGTTYNATLSDNNRDFEKTNAQQLLYLLQEYGAPEMGPELWEKVKDPWSHYGAMYYFHPDSFDPCETDDSCPE